MRRRQFFQKALSIGAASMLPPLLTGKSREVAAALAHFQHRSPQRAARDEAFWEQVRLAYDLTGPYVNFNSGGANPAPADVAQEAYAYDEAARSAPAFTLWRRQARLLEYTRQRLAAFVGCSPEQISLQTNTTTAMATVIAGLDLPAGSEILTTDQDYPTVVHTLRMYARRRNWRVKTMPLSSPLPGPEQALEQLQAACSPDTRLAILSHMLFRTGEMLPIQAFCHWARDKHILTAIDGAHMVGQVPLSIPELGCDYFASSLHKWLGAPLGTGMLYIHPDRIEGLWPQYGYLEGEETNIRKFEHVGTRSLGAHIGIAAAIRFQESIGMERKWERLRYLTDYWTMRLSDIPEARLMTRLLSPDQYGAMATLSLPLRADRHLENWLNRERGYLVGYEGTYQDRQMARISANVFLMPRDFDALMDSIHSYQTTYNQ